MKKGRSWFITYVAYFLDQPPPHRDRQLPPLAAHNFFALSLKLTRSPDDFRGFGEQVGTGMKVEDPVFRTGAVNRARRG